MQSTVVMYVIYTVASFFVLYVYTKVTERVSIVILHHNYLKPVRILYDELINKIKKTEVLYMAVRGMCSLTSSAVHIKRVYDMLLWIMWHF